MHNDQRQQQALTEVVPLVASTTPVIVGGPVVGLKVGVLGLGSRIVRQMIDEKRMPEQRGRGREMPKVKGACEAMAREF
jgi:hypothetical protein